MQTLVTACFGRKPQSSALLPSELARMTVTTAHRRPEKHRLQRESKRVHTSSSRCMPRCLVQCHLTLSCPLDSFFSRCSICPDSPSPQSQVSSFKFMSTVQVAPTTKFQQEKRKEKENSVLSTTVHYYQTRPNVHYNEPTTLLLQPAPKSQPAVKSSDY